MTQGLQVPAIGESPAIPSEESRFPSPAVQQTDGIALPPTTSAQSQEFIAQQRTLQSQLDALRQQLSSNSEPLAATKFAAFQEQKLQADLLKQQLELVETRMTSLEHDALAYEQAQIEKRRAFAPRLISVIEAGAASHNDVKAALDEVEHAARVFRAAVIHVVIAAVKHRQNAARYQSTMLNAHGKVAAEHIELMREEIRQAIGFGHVADIGSGFDDPEFRRQFHISDYSLLNALTTALLQHPESKACAQRELAQSFDRSTAVREAEAWLKSS